MPLVEDCPFCGHDDPEIGEIAPGSFAVDCPECQCIGPFGDRAEVAITLWNKAHQLAKELNDEASKLAIERESLLKRLSAVTTMLQHYEKTS